MKKVLFIIMALAITVSASAQSDRRLGLSVGGGFVNEFFVLNNLPNDNLDNSYYFGPYVEVGYDWNIEKLHGFYAGVRYEFLNRHTGAGCYVPSPYYPYYPVAIGCDANTYRHFIDVPFKYRLTWDINGYNKFFCDLGPTLNFMVGNVTYFNELTPMVWKSKKVNWNSVAPDAYNWFDLSLGVNVGVFINQAKIFIGYDYAGIISYTNEDLGRGQMHQLRIGASFVF